MGQAEFFDSIAKEWDDIIEVNEYKINILLSKLNIKDNTNILDVGTGTGVLIPFIKQLNPNGNITGIDISKEMINIASEKFKDINKLSFKLVNVENGITNGEYDKIILYSMFPHLQNRTSTIKSLVHNNLKDGGQLMIAHSNSREFLNNMHKEKNEVVREDRLICVKSQKNLFEEAGLNVVEAFENDDIYYLVINKN
ncbi:class I SAM-dependent methyltransferase [[Clostridium] dakarense]|uniref:class I SAM-dependent methyltransferase n=1 Tax=Faecalimicrobium dakarense TaxID=1301100 RepID=UPI0004AD584A|nr:class I SAM-dependent methyltransferase [[Clostridium] dakarense]